MYKLGLQIHVSLNDKLTCRCDSSCQICRGTPGSLPLPPSFNCLEKTGRVLKYLNFQLKPLIFYRKHYHYPDLPCGFQRTQHPKYPLGVGGFLNLPPFKHSQQCVIPFDRIQLQQDPAATRGKKVDFTRAGRGLLELVTPPFWVFEEFTETQQFKLKYLFRTINLLFKQLGCGDLKIDVNLSYNQGPRVEIKNLNSLENILAAIDLECFWLKANPDLATSVTKEYVSHLNKTRITREKQNYFYTLETNLPAFSKVQLPVELPLTLHNILLWLQTQNKPINSETLKKCKQLLKTVKTLDQLYEKTYQEHIEKEETKLTKQVTDIALKHFDKSLQVGDVMKKIKTELKQQGLKTNIQSLYHFLYG